MKPIRTVYMLFACYFCFGIAIDVFPQEDTFIFGDPLPDAPALSFRGDYQVGVRTFDLTHKNQPDIQNFVEKEEPTYDRKLTVEVWYPANHKDNAVPVQYKDYFGAPNDEKRPLTPFTFPGRAVREADPERSESPYPLVIVSHGYLGSRFLMTYLTENLASKGYVVVAIHHTESTHENPGKFASTLYHRSKDQLFVLEEMGRLGKENADNFLAGLVDADQTALVGYSMGGYGVLNAGGAGYAPGFVNAFGQMTAGSRKLSERSLADPAYRESVDPRIKAIVAFAPWGMARGAWDDEGLQNLKIPTLFIAGDQDDISGYDKGVKAIFEGAKNTERYMLTYLNARHNVAPNPPLSPDLNKDDYMHYAEPVWDERRINNINQHFLTAFLDLHLKGKNERARYLDLPQNSLDETWEGFIPRTSIGLEWRQEKPGL
ncbi:alpha/beta hydrolase family protein [Cyclobacterium plantarum]|uniref:Dienelactone hydrolase n=1 Tax=Cyclobacterium plantarum TaxID=2716263 RepID=A0ABX0HFM7_9BACT|nr:dienelactone hydrolase [Cyclobacterium plantarum]NHE58850.1 dienelactone hydrolase [Cyclobacterium plantarum]